MSTDEILRLMIDLERQAGKILLSANNITAENKTDRRDVVTKYDKRIQSFLVDSILKQIPDAGFFCEESDIRAGVSDGRVFSIDPIDGTMNFVHGLKCSCISIAYLFNGEVLAAAVYNPFLDELFSAEKGKGARMNDESIHASTVKLSDSLISVGTSPYRQDLSIFTFETARKLFETGLDIRRSGSAELDLCSVAAGRIGLYYEQDLSLWDYAAGYLIATEAGAVCTMADGNSLPWSGEKSSIVAATPQAHEDYLKLFT